MRHKPEKVNNLPEGRHWLEWQRGGAPHARPRRCRDPLDPWRGSVTIRLPECTRGWTDKIQEWRNSSGHPRRQTCANPLRHYLARGSVTSPGVTFGLLGYCVITLISFFPTLCDFFLWHAWGLGCPGTALLLRNGI